MDLWEPCRSTGTEHLLRKLVRYKKGPYMPLYLSGPLDFLFLSEYCKERFCDIFFPLHLSQQKYFSLVSYKEPEQTLDGNGLLHREKELLF